MDSVLYSAQKIHDNTLFNTLVLPQIKVIADGSRSIPKHHGKRKCVTVIFCSRSHLRVQKRAKHEVVCLIQCRVHCKRNSPPAGLW